MPFFGDSPTIVTKWAPKAAMWTEVGASGPVFVRNLATLASTGFGKPLGWCHTHTQARMLAETATRLRLHRHPPARLPARAPARSPVRPSQSGPKIGPNMVPT